MEDFFKDSIHLNHMSKFKFYVFNELSPPCRCSG